MDLDVIITGGVGVITSTISSLVAWFLAKRKYNAEVDQNNIENMQKSLDFYIQLSDDTQKRLAEMNHRNMELEKEVRELRQQVTTLMNNICIDVACRSRKTGTELFGNKIKNETKISEKTEE